METVGYHTVNDLDNADIVESQGPFPSMGSLAFLGGGYYFWEDNIDLAHWWGEVHYNGSYMITEGNITCEASKFLDLVGSPKDMRFLKALQAELKDELIRFFGTDRVPLGELIEFLKRIKKFPFKVIRAVDSSSKSADTVRFVKRESNYIDLSPRIIICLLERNTLILQDFRIIYPQKYVI